MSPVAQVISEAREIMKTISISKLRQNIYNIIKNIIDDDEPLQVTTKYGSAFLVPESYMRSITETLYLLSVPGMREALIEGKNTPIEECLTPEDVGWDI